jgi:hypothetical protein
VAQASFSFDLIEVVRSRRLDFYGAVRLVNFIRKAVEAAPSTSPAGVIVDDAPSGPGLRDEPRAEIVAQATQASDFLHDDSYLSPVLADDAYLRFIDIIVEEKDDDDDDDDMPELAVSGGDASPSAAAPKPESDKDAYIRRLEAQLGQYWSWFKLHVRGR